MNKLKGNKHKQKNKMKSGSIYVYIDIERGMPKKTQAKMML